MKKTISYNHRIASRLSRFCVINELTMQKTEESIFGNRRHDLIFLRYVNHCFAFTMRCQLDTFLAFINTINVDIQFTCKKVEKNYIVFLETRLTKTTEHTLISSVYRKPTPMIDSKVTTVTIRLPQVKPCISSSNLIIYNMLWCRKQNWRVEDKSSGSVKQWISWRIHWWM